MEEKDTKIKSGHFYLVENKSADQIVVLGKTFIGFDVLDSRGNLVDTYDFINIESPIRVDFEKVNGKAAVRLYPSILDKGLTYDLETHSIAAQTEEF